MDTLFSHVNILTLDERLSVWNDAFLGVTDGKIAYLGKKPPEGKPQKIIDGTGMVLMPGLINCHTHLPMSLLRGYADDLPLDEWLRTAILPREQKLDGRAVRAATLLSIAECLRFGTTSVSDMYGYCGEIAQAVAESGIKANLSHSSTLWPGESFSFDTHPDCIQTEELFETWNGYDNGRIRVAAAIHAEYTSSYPLWDALAEYAISSGMPMHLHLSETKREHEECVERHGLTPAQVLDCHHVFDVPTTAAHCVHLTAEDMQLLAKRRVSAAHCPVSNLKLASGTADVRAMVRAGMNVCLGTDGAAANNNLDMFEEMKAASLTAREKTGDAKALPAQAVVMMATVCGARAQGRSAECGMIKEGMDADLILVDFNQPHLIPCHDIFSNLVFSASGHDVVMTMVRGNILYFAGKYPTIDVAASLRELHDYAIPKVFSRDKESEA